MSCQLSTDPLGAPRLLQAREVVEKKEGGVIFVGIDWSEDHHDVCVMNVEGRVLGKGRVPDGLQGPLRGRAPADMLVIRVGGYLYHVP